MTSSRARFWTWIAVFAALHAGAFRAIAQEQDEAKQAAASQSQVTRVLRVSHISAEDAFDVLRNVVSGRYNDNLGVITVNGTPEQVDEFERALRQIDVPRPAQSPGDQRNVVLTVYFVGVSDSTAASPLPEILQPAITELRKHFPYENYALLETFAIRASRGNRAAIEGVMPGSPGPFPTTYGFEADIDTVTGEAGQELIGLHHVAASWRVPLQKPSGEYNFNHVRIRTKLRIPAGKTIVVGKAGTAGVSEGLFVIMRADVP